MKKDYSELLRLILLLKAKVFVVQSKYSDLNLDEINIYELDEDINAIGRLASGISFKKNKIRNEMMENYFKEFYEQETLKLKQEKVIE